MIIDLNDPISIEAMQGLLTRKALKNKKVGLTSGCWDLYHFYHLHYFTRCRAYCDILIVGVDSNEFVRQVKGKNRPKVDEQHRLAIVNDSKQVAMAFIMNSIEDFGQMAELVKPDIIFKNQAFKKSEVVGRFSAKEVVIIPDINIANSTSELIEKIVSEGR